MPIETYGGVTAGSVVLAFVSRLEERVADEQVQQILAPVLAMIRAGAFDRQAVQNDYSNKYTG